MTMVQSNTDLSYGLSCFEAYLSQSWGLLVIVVRFHTGLGLFCLSCVRLDYPPFPFSLPFLWCKFSALKVPVGSRAFLCPLYLLDRGHSMSPLAPLSKSSYNSLLFFVYLHQCKCRVH